MKNANVLVVALSVLAVGAASLQAGAQGMYRQDRGGPNVKVNDRENACRSTKLERELQSIKYRGQKSR